MQAAPPAPPRVARRSSYNPSSTTKADAPALNLGVLPPRQFHDLPLGQRSVPAVELRRVLEEAAPRLSAAPGEPRTPGGSLVVGSEVFGFGRQPRLDRWSSGGYEAAGAESVNDVITREELGKAQIRSDGFQLNGGDTDRAEGGREYAGAVQRDLSQRGDEFQRPVRPAPDTLKGYASSHDVRSASEEEIPRAKPPVRPNGTRSKSALPLDLHKSIDSLGLGLPAPAPDVDSSNGFSYAGDETPSRSSQASSSTLPPSSRSARAGYQYYDTQYQSAPQSSQDQLAYGLQNVHLNEDHRTNGNDSRHVAPAQLDRSQYNNAYGTQESQQSSIYPNYFSQPSTSQYLAQDSYVDYTDPLTYFRAGVTNGSQAMGDARTRESINYPQSFHPWGNPSSTSDYSHSIPNNSIAGHISRQESSLYSPATSQQSLTPYGLAPGGSFGSPLTDRHSALHSAALNHQQLLQQQMMLFRGMRSTPEYTAPGPPASSLGYGSTYGGNGYAGNGYNGNGGNPHRYEDVGRIMRSPLLEEFRANRHRSWELMDLVNHIVEFSGDQLGSRHIQQKLDSASTEEKQLVFTEILPNLLQLSTDVFANYVIQKLFEQGTQVQKTTMANALEGHILQLSLQMYGCRVVQKAFEYVLVDQQVRLIQELDGHVLKCSKDAQSNHVVQRALERIPSDRLDFIVDACIGQVHSLATHPYGCRVLQRVFENCSRTQTRSLLEDLHRFTQNLIQDQYGNYVIQWVVEKGDPIDRNLVISKISGQLLILAQQKFASNVIEKCIIFASEEERRKLVQEVLKPALDGSSKIKAMLVHPFANYVMQKILITASGSQRNALFAETATQLDLLKKYSTNYSKHLISIEKLLHDQHNQHRIDRY